MTADPRIVKHAYPVQSMSYKEALELAMYGARLFHPRTMLPLIETGVPMVIRKTSEPDGASTTITASGSKQGPDDPTCVTSLEKLSMLEIRSNKLEEPGRLAGRVMSCLEQANVTIYNSSESAHGQSVGVLVQQAYSAVAVAAIEVCSSSTNHHRASCQ